MSKAKKNTITQLLAVDTYEEIRKLRLTVYEWGEACNAAEELLHGKTANTICTNVAKHFEKHGFDVALSTNGVYYTIRG